MEGGRLLEGGAYYQNYPRKGALIGGRALIGRRALIRGFTVCVCACARECVFVCVHECECVCTMTMNDHQ